MLYQIMLRPISLLTLPLLTVLDSDFPGNLPTYKRVPPLNIKIMLESSPLKSTMLVRRSAVLLPPRATPSSHSKNSLSKIRSKGWAAQKSLFDRQFDGGAKIFQGLGPKRHESWIANWVYMIT